MELSELDIRLLLEMDELGFHITHSEVQIIVIVLMIFSHFDVGEKFLLILTQI